MKADRQKVRLAMERARMTVHDVAKAADLPPQTAAAIICGMNVHPDTLARIAQALDVGIADIAQGAVPGAYGREATSPPRALETPPLPAGQVKVDTEKFAQVWARSRLSVKELAERAGVSPEVVRSIKRGAAAHKVGTVEKLADALGVAVCSIIKREENT